MPERKWRGNWEEFGKLSDPDRCLIQLKEIGKGGSRFAVNILDCLAVLRNIQQGFLGVLSQSHLSEESNFSWGGPDSVSLLCSVTGWSSPGEAWPPPQLSGGLQSVVAEAQGQSHSL